MIGGERAPPTAAPVLKMPMPSARSRTGNHSPTALAAPGQLPASPKPQHPAPERRSSPTVRAKKCAMAAADHTMIENVNPSRVPMAS